MGSDCAVICNLIQTQCAIHDLSLYSPETPPPVSTSSSWGSRTTCAFASHQPPPHSWRRLRMLRARRLLHHQRKTWSVALGKSPALGTSHSLGGAVPNPISSETFEVAGRKSGPRQTAKRRPCTVIAYKTKIYFELQNIIILSGPQICHRVVA